MHKSRLIAVGILSLLATTATALGAAPSGNQRAVALARAQQRAYSKVRAVAITQTGFASMIDQEGKTSYFDWTWGHGVVAPGWSKATEHELLGLRNGRVAWWRDDLTPPPCNAAGICTRIPVEVVGERSGMFFAFGSAGKHTCYGDLHGTIPYPVGTQFDSVLGRFDAPVRRGRTIRLTYTYPWFGLATQTATETDTSSARTLLLESARVKVARGPGNSRPAFTYRFSDHTLAHAPRAPSINLCHS